jgi:large subunit ribosomal protein L25
MVDFVLNAKAREDKGKGASRRLRRLASEVPAIVYGGKKKPQPLALDHDSLYNSLENEAFFSHIITLNVGDKSEQVIVKDVQRHPSRLKLLHVDFMRVSKTQKLQTKVPIHFLNEDTSKGVKQQGGIVSHAITELEIQCLPGDLPEYLEVDMAEVELGDTLHISDIPLPKGVESVDLLHGEEYDHPLVAIIKPRSAAAEAEEEEEAAAAAEESETAAKAKEEPKEEPGDEE